METTDLRALLAAATDLPWSVSPLAEMGSVDDDPQLLRCHIAIQRLWRQDEQTFAEVLRAKFAPADAALIVAAVNALPGHLDEIEGERRSNERQAETIARLTAERDEARKSLEAMNRRNVELLAAERRVGELESALRSIGEYTGNGPHTTPWQDIVRDVGAAARAALTSSGKVAADG